MTRSLVESATAVTSALAATLARAAHRARPLDELRGLTVRVQPGKRDRPLAELPPLGARGASLTCRIAIDDLDASSEPRQGHLPDCWLLAPMLATFRACPTWAQCHVRSTSVRLWVRGEWRAIRVYPYAAATRESIPGFAHTATGLPGWPSLLEQAAVFALAGTYPALGIGFASTGLRLLTGPGQQSRLGLPGARRLTTLLAEGRAVVASTAPWARRSSGVSLRPRHVYAVVAADPVAMTVTLADPIGGPSGLPVELTVSTRALRGLLLAVDISAALA